MSPTTQKDACNSAAPGSQMHTAGNKSLTWVNLIGFRACKLCGWTSSLPPPKFGASERRHNHPVNPERFERPAMGAQP